MHGLTLEEQKALLRSFGRIFLTLTALCFAVAGFAYLRGENRAAMLIAGLIGPVPLVCWLMQLVEIRQLRETKP
jgi:hypothetical protein